MVVVVGGEMFQAEKIIFFLGQLRPGWVGSLKLTPVQDLPRSPEFCALVLSLKHSPEANLHPWG